ncbi:hypothetical protein P6F26_16665 [Roseibacterium sp. SDUM158017]|nr:hypothetical protein [Roseibacterium sp. SDUM158017]
MTGPEYRIEGDTRPLPRASILPPDHVSMAAPVARRAWSQLSIAILAACALAAAAVMTR